jgi:hypothetical protein
MYQVETRIDWYHSWPPFFGWWLGNIFNDTLVLLS